MMEPPGSYCAYACLYITMCLIKIFTLATDTFQEQYRYVPHCFSPFSPIFFLLLLSAVVAFLLCLFLNLILLFYPPIFLLITSFICATVPSSFPLAFSLSLSISLSLSLICMCVYVTYVSLSIAPSLSLSLCPSIYLSVYLSISLFLIRELLYPIVILFMSDCVFPLLGLFVHAHLSSSLTI